MNSFSGVERALELEFRRQVEVLDSGGNVQQQTMLWDGGSGTVRPSRTKEGSHDYRYFPEPDLPPLILAAEWIAKSRHDLPELPAARRRRFASEYKLGEHDVDVLTASPRLADYYESVSRAHGDAKTAANWVMGEVLAQLKILNVDIDYFRVRPHDLAELLNLVRDGIVTHTAAKQVFFRMVETGDPPAQVAERDGLVKIDDDMQLSAWLAEVMIEHPAEVARYRAGEKKLQGVLIGAVMRKSKGRADPKKLHTMIGERLT